MRDEDYPDHDVAISLEERKRMTQIMREIIPGYDNQKKQYNYKWPAFYRKNKAEIKAWRKLHEQYLRQLEHGPGGRGQSEDYE